MHTRGSVCRHMLAGYHPKGPLWSPLELSIAEVVGGTGGRRAQRVEVGPGWRYARTNRTTAHASRTIHAAAARQVDGFGRVAKVDHEVKIGQRLVIGQGRAPLVITPTRCVLVLAQQCAQQLVYI